MRRPRPADRPAARKQRLARLEDDREFKAHVLAEIASLRTETQRVKGALKKTHSALVQTQVEVLTVQQHRNEIENKLELHETLERILQGFNDLIYDTRRKSTSARSVLSLNDKKALKAAGFGYITQLLDDERKPIKNAAVPLNIDAIRRKTLTILAPNELALCQRLSIQLDDGRVGRNAQQHPKPDASTALARVEALKILPPLLLAELEAFLGGNPQRMKLQTDKPETDRSLFAQVGSYHSAQAERERLSCLKTDQAKFAHDLWQQGGEDQEDEAESWNTADGYERKNLRLPTNSVRS
ncbi:hypothetical protein C8F04DRAFT_247326 [Mycena alexandri]|uniref:Uncharacterized protein n=1 Tax=Mycena alexandri TaxID=1745969 RepID=A0AAD6S6E1_9AGAR|nr:hypothetical protein C8F04DRAFT_247326 [Mycena alexandri]